MGADDNLAHMVGVWGGKRPNLTIAGNIARLPYEATHNLGDGKYCVLDNALDADTERDVIAALHTYAKPPKRKRKRKTDEDVTPNDNA